MQYDELYSRAIETLTASGLSERWLDLGCETGSQNRLNRQSIDRFVLETQLIGATEATTHSELLGLKLDSPIIGSAISRGRVLENIKHASVPWFETPPYLEEMTVALGRCNSILGIGIVEPKELVAIANTGSPYYHIVKPYPDEDEIADHLRLAELHGAVAVGMDITPSFGHKAWDENPQYDKGVKPKTAEQLTSYVQMTKLPFIVKGVLSVKDAKTAEAVGAAAVVVSNHGGESIDYSRPVLHSLRDIREACPNLTIIVDSGFRRGSDVLKALCLGADAVAIATPLIVGFAASGAEGVEAMYRALVAELQRTMSSCGFGSVSDVNSSVLYELA